MTQTNSLIPVPQSNGFLPGAGSPRDSAMAAGLQKANLLNDLNNAAARGGKKRYRGGATNTTQPTGDRITISIPEPSYANANGGQGVTNQTMQNAGNVAQLSVNNDFFKNVQAPIPIPANQLKLKGGYSYERKRRGIKREKKAGTRIMGPNTTWGCHSGGKRRKRKTKRQATKRVKRRSTKRRYG